MLEKMRAAELWYAELCWCWLTMTKNELSLVCHKCLIFRPANQAADAYAEEYVEHDICGWHLRHL